MAKTRCTLTLHPPPVATGGMAVLMSPAATMSTCTHHPVPRRGSSEDRSSVMAAASGPTQLSGRETGPEPHQWAASAIEMHDGQAHPLVSTRRGTNAH